MENYTPTLNIQAFLDQDEKKDLLRLLTAGSVDDGKSTLIGRLLHDTKLLVDLVGPAQAKRILFTGTLLTAAEALAIGMVTLLDTDPAAALDRITSELVAVSGHSQRMSKVMVQRILDGQVADDDTTRAEFAAAFDGDDFAEGVSAFLAKRPPVFR